MGTYTAQEHIDLFGGLPEPGEAIPDFDAIRDEQKYERLWCPACREAADRACASECCPL